MAPKPVMAGATNRERIPDGTESCGRSGSSRKRVAACAMVSFVRHAKAATVTSTNKYTMKGSCSGHGVYWASNPETSAPTPRPRKLALVAIAVARVLVFFADQFREPGSAGPGAQANAQTAENAADIQRSDIAAEQKDQGEPGRCSSQRKATRTQLFVRRELELLPCAHPAHRAVSCPQGPLSRAGLNAEMLF
jgi:hypothetical protein